MQVRGQVRVLIVTVYRFLPGGMRPARDRYSHSYCSRDEVEGIRAQVEQFMTLIAENVPDAAQNYEAFKAERAAFVRESTRVGHLISIISYEANPEILSTSKRAIHGVSMPVLRLSASIVAWWIGILDAFSLSCRI